MQVTLALRVGLAGGRDAGGMGDFGGGSRSGGEGVPLSPNCVANVKPRWRLGRPLCLHLYLAWPFVCRSHVCLFYVHVLCPFMCMSCVMCVCVVFSLLSLCSSVTLPLYFSVDLLFSAPRWGHLLMLRSRVMLRSRESSAGGYAPRPCGVHGLRDSFFRCSFGIVLSAVRRTAL